MNISIALPEIAILSFALLALLGDLFCAKRWPNISYYCTQLGLIIAFSIGLFQFTNSSSIDFGNLLISDPLAKILKLFIYISVFFTFLYANDYNLERKIPRSEFYVLGLCSTLGMLTLVSANSLLTIYLGLELLSLPLYAMVALQRDDTRASEAAMKYFVMGGIASGILLYGMSMLYGATATMIIPDIAKAISAMPSQQLFILAFGLIFLIVGIGFKLAAAPFHMWAPDVYSGAPTSATLFLSAAPKLAALGMATRLLLGAMPSISPVWQQLIMIMAVFSVLVGNLFAIAQTNIKRMLAYSAIAHIGYMLFGLAAGEAMGYTSALFYILIYAIMSLGAFGMVVLMSQRGIEAENIEDFRGLNKRNPWFAFMFMIILLSMAGIPPTAGFFAKLMIIQALVSANYITMATIAMLLAIIGAFYYIRVIKVMYFDEPTESTALSFSMTNRVAMTANGLALLALGLFPAALFNLCRMVFGG